MDDFMNYNQHLKEMTSAAYAWEELAEIARSEGDLSVANLCAQRAIRCRYLAEPEPDIETFFRKRAARIKGGEWTPGMIAEAIDELRK